MNRQHLLGIVLIISVVLNLALFYELYQSTTYSVENRLLISRDQAFQIGRDWLDSHNMSVTNLNGLAGYSVVDLSNFSQVVNQNQWTISSGMVVPSNGTMLYWLVTYDSSLDTNTTYLVWINAVTGEVTAWLHQTTPSENETVLMFPVS